ncbi:MAG: type V CRISPR-associated protein Cpf1 [Pseudobutyrivibrio ruminis]|nr:type V CRISPR-associated protein Cpf1 [Pseudobutyrivibrio ruminis]
MLNYEDYTKRKQVTKAIRFELIPTETTQKNLEEHEILKQDQALYAALDRIKPIVDSFIKDITNKALKELTYDFNVLKDAKEEGRKAYDKAEKELFKAIDKSVSESLPKELSVSKINSAKFLQDSLTEYVLNTNDKSIKKDEAIKDIETTKGCLALFSKFLTTRITALTVWMPQRVVENFNIYCSNIEKIKNVLENAEFDSTDFQDELIKMVNVSYYEQVLTQTDIDGYNSIIQGNSNEEGIVFKGLNQRINEFNTRIRNEKRDVRALRKLDMLNKQILTPQEKKFKIETITSDDEVRSVIKTSYSSFSEASKALATLLLEKQMDSDGAGIIIKGNKLHQLSHLLTGNHTKITDAIVQEESNAINKMLEDETLKPSMRRELQKRLEILPSHIIKSNYEMTALDKYLVNEDKSVIAEQKSTFSAYISEYNNAVKTVHTYYSILEGGDVFKSRKIKGNRHMQEMIADFFAELTAVRDILFLINLPNDEDGDFAFYDTFDELYDAIRNTYKAENLVRNYLTKSVKDTAEEKQTCLGSPARLRAMWWNGEKKFSKDLATIIKHEDKYYYFVLSEDAKPITVAEVEDSKTSFLTFKKGQKSFMMLPKILFKDHATPFFENNKTAEEYVLDDECVSKSIAIDRKIYDIYKDGLFKREAVTGGLITEDEYKKNIAMLIDTYKLFANAYVQYSKFDMTQLNDTDSYADIGEFFSDVDIYTSKLSWTSIDFKQIENLVEHGQGYLFLISNRFLYAGKADKNPYSKVFLSILSDENMKKSTILLNSNPSIYYRPRILESKITHKTGSFLVNRLTEDGEPIPKAIYETIYKLKNDFTNIADEDIKEAKEYMNTHKVIAFKSGKDVSYQKRYMQDKYILQLTYTKNNDISDRTIDMLNDRIIEAIEDGYNVVSISRSTNDLVYISVFDKDFNVIEKRSLNKIDGIDYYALLKDAYKDKKEDKKAWIYDTSSGNLKAAYIDCAITEILKVAKKYNAIIVVESLSDRFKDKYSFLDNQVFKTFETRIAERLFDLSFKDVKSGRAGSVNNPLQLANNSGNSYQDGVLFYVNNSFTRGLDIKTGFTNIFATDRIKSIQAKRQFLAKMDNIEIQDNKITFSFDYANYDTRFETKKTKWSTIFNGEAVVYDREKKTNTRVENVITDEIIPAAGIADITGNVAEKIIDKQIPGAFVETLYKWFIYSINGIQKKTAKSDEIYRSPITGEDYAVNEVTTYNLARKLVFRLQYDGSSENFNSEWLNYVQQ